MQDIEKYKNNYLNLQMNRSYLYIRESISIY